jgi:Fe2+ transport system protein B
MCLIVVYFYLGIYQIMNKSTPLSQLPPHSFVNDQQRNMVMQAQNAIGSLPMPQNTQQTTMPPAQSNDTNNDDDATIQEVLNQIHGNMTDTDNIAMPEIDGGNVVKHPMMPPQLMTQNNQHAQYIQQQPSHMQMLDNQQQQLQQLQQLQGLQQIQQLQQLQQLQQQVQSETDNDTHSFTSFMKSIAEDIKFGAFVFVLFIAVHFVPVDKLLTRYFALEKIPHYDIVLKALVAFVVVVILRKSLQNL